MVIKDKTGDPFSMDIDYKKKYKLILNWGAFDSPEDTSMDYIYGHLSLR